MYLGAIYFYTATTTTKCLTQKPGITCTTNKHYTFSTLSHKLGLPTSLTSPAIRWQSVPDITHALHRSLQIDTQMFTSPITPRTFINIWNRIKQDKYYPLGLLYSISRQRYLFKFSKNVTHRIPQGSIVYVHCHKFWMLTWLEINLTDISQLRCLIGKINILTILLKSKLNYRFTNSFARDYVQVYKQLYF